MNHALFSTHPGKAAAERYYLWYTPAWGLATGAVMLTGLAERWGDIECMIFGLVLWAGVLLPPFFWRAEEDKAKPFYELYHFKIQLWMFFFSFLGNYFGTRYFYEILHMHYGFRTTWNLNHVPFFLYLVTIAYFTTYCTLLNIGYRWVCSRIPAGNIGLRRLAIFPVALAVAGLESALNANPWMKRLFCYDDLFFVLWFGTLMYGTWFAITLPLWFDIDETPEQKTPLLHCFLGVMAGFMMILCAMEIFKYGVAPLFTEVKAGAIGLRDYVGSCLQR